MVKPLHVATLAGLRGVRVGEAQVPGPQGSEDSFIFVINTQGAPGGWKTYEENLFGAQVVAFQDIGMSDAEWAAFARCAGRRQFSCYRHKGSETLGHWGETRHRGGVAFIVHRLIRHSISRGISSFDAQIGLLSFERFMNYFAGL